MPESIIIVSHLVKRYEKVTAVDDVSFEVREGEVFGLLGPNGAGKTTTLEIIETLNKPTSGSITVDGIDVQTRPNEVKPRIGIQLQSAGYYPYLTLTEILGMFGVAYGMPVDAAQLLAKMNLTEKSKATYNTLSGGQKQRFSIATTLVNKPRVIFLDEPTTGLDPQARVSLWDVIRELKSEGTTVVITTHYMDEAEKLCDRLAIMDRGKIIAEGTPVELIDNLLASGFESKRQIQPATLDDVFLHLTGRSLDA
ncbi:MAG TPA: ABC transporter ATP-binding protein [Fimbriimonadaceae bacterium]|nr:ABC transporter ATP-binding protein [Fimbriimonadaceae bacterium]